jgi:hypothetical protein
MAGAMMMVMVVGSGCQSDRPALEAATVTELSGMRYPEGEAWGPDLDVVVVREGRKLRLVNRTARVYAGVRLWVNQQYVSELMNVEIGTGNAVALNQLVNEHGEAFAVGSFLQPDKGMTVVSAELHDEEGSVRHKLVVQPKE